MSEVFYAGEVKVRAGTYWRYTNEGGWAVEGAINGIVGCLFRSSWGPLNKAVEVGLEEGYADTFGTGGTTDVMKYALQGGGRTLICCRAGSGGTVSSAQVKGTGDDVTAGSIQAKYVGAKAFSYTIKDDLADPAVRLLLIYEGTALFEKIGFQKGGDETAALEAAMALSQNFVFVKTENASGLIPDVSQAVFIKGTDPLTAVSDYSSALEVMEAYKVNTIVLDTEDTAVHALLQAFIQRVYGMGQFALGVVAEKSSVELDTRMQHAAAFNDECMHYVLNPDINVGDTELDGYQTAAVVAGMIAGYPSNVSLTHKVVKGATEVRTRLTGSRIQAGIKSGCIVLTQNSSGQVWIDTAVNTLVNPSGEKDEGWKSIRRTKTRFELIERAGRQAELYVGEVDNDANGRATIVGSVQNVGNTMIAENKLSYCKVTESAEFTSDGNYAFFDINAVDKESGEKLYLTFRFRFSTTV